jgi:hypothetical protein
VEDCSANPAGRARSFAGPELKPGSRFQLTQLGNQRCPKLRGRTGTIISLTRTQSTFRVQLDGTKSPRSMHRTYIMPIDPVEMS